MADVRALLRQQRAARRIDHPAAAYSDAGKLLCTVCHEHIKTESLWDGHLRTASHRQRLQPPSPSTTTANPPAELTNGTSGGPHKRKLDDPDVDMTTDSPDSPDSPNGDAVRRKRSRPDMVDTTTAADATTPKPKPLTPPLTRRQSSSTPTLGVELQIPSRPATPVATSSSFRADATSTPKPAVTPKPQHPPPTSAPEDNNNTDDVWAAFEADLVHAKPAAPPPAVAGFADEIAVISAPAMSAAEIAAKSHDEEHEKRRALADVQRDDEREDATRALEAEFEVMEELEARARRLRERREALRVQRGGDVAERKAGGEGAGKENSSNRMRVVEEEEDEDDDEEDDWDGFRFRA